MSDNFNDIDNNASENINNPYSKQYEQKQLSVLEEGAPQLNSPIGQTINKKAIAFLIAASLGTIGIMAFAFQMLKEPEEEKKTERPEVVTVPELPQEPPQATIAPNNTSAVPLEADGADSDLKQMENQNQAMNIVPVTSNVDVAEQQQLVRSSQSQPMEIPQINGIADMRKDTSSFVEEGNVTDGKSAGVASVRSLSNRDKLLVQGTYLRCVLETKIVSDVAGFTSCIITEPVYSANGQYSLIPKGSKVMGQYGSTNPVSPRLAVMWDRIITPNGLDITLRSPGVDNLGAAGHVGDFRTHWQSRLASALLISMISDVFKYAAAEHGPKGETVTNGNITVTNPYESETANTLKQVAIDQLERNNFRPNTVTINQGTLINIYTAQDVDFSSVLP